jgi:hypothetical protein
MSVYIQPNGGIYLTSPVYIDGSQIQPTSGGTWSPTFTLQGNLSAVANVVSTYIQVGSIVTVCLSLNTTVTTASVATVLNVTNLPVPSNVFSNTTPFGMGMYFDSSTTADNVQVMLIGGTIIQQLRWTPSSNGGHPVSVQYQYIVS